MHLHSMNGSAFASTSKRIKLTTTFTCIFLYIQVGKRLKFKAIKICVKNRCSFLSRSLQYKIKKKKKIMASSVMIIGEEHNSTLNNHIMGKDVSVIVASERIENTKTQRK